MLPFSGSCFLCLNISKNLHCIQIEYKETKNINEKLKYCFPELVLNGVKLICNDCISKLDCFYDFKQMCLQNNTNLKNHVHPLKSKDESHKHISVRRTLPNLGPDDGFRIGKKEDNEGKEAEVVFKSEIKHLLFNEEKDIVEEKRLTDNVYQELESQTKCISIPSDTNVIKREEFENSSHSGRNISSNSEANKVKKADTFQCAICSKEYLCKSLLENHLKLHIGIQEFGCSICNKKFMYKSDMILHEKIHEKLQMLYVE